MSLRSAAIAQHEAEQTNRTDEARAALGVVLAPFDVAPLEVEHVEVTTAYTLIVFTDGDIHLGVRTRGEGWDVHIVADQNGWTDLVEITSLGHLGKVLPDFDPVDENAAPTYPAWDTGIAVKVGERYTYGGFTWQVVQAHTTQAGWEPPNLPSLWTKVV